MRAGEAEKYWRECQDILDGYLTIFLCDEIVLTIPITIFLKKLGINQLLKVAVGRSKRIHTN